jgi:hypothetical protein
VGFGFCPQGMLGFVEFRVVSVCVASGVG